jgi:hypothetical protein
LQETQEAGSTEASESPEEENEGSEEKKLTVTMQEAEQTLPGRLRRLPPTGRVQDLVTLIGEAS